MKYNFHAKTQKTPSNFFALLAPLHETFFVLFFIFLTTNIFSQDTIPSENYPLEQNTENISEQLQTEEIDFSESLEKLTYYKEHPLNLNSATKDELEQLNLLNEIQINNLLS